MLTDEQLSKLRKAGRVSAEARELGMSLVKAGGRLYDVAQEVEGYIREHGCGLAFPCNVSRNAVAAHYTPCVDDKTVFEIGDVVKIDCGAEIDGYVGDTAGTVEVGTKRYTALIEISKRARNTVAEFFGEGTKLCDVGRAVEMCMKSEGFTPIMNLCGHQIEPYNLHAGLSVPSYDNGDVTKVKAGSVIAVEPFATNGVGRVVNGPPGNIVRMIRDRKVDDPAAREFLDYVKGEFRTFPFCARSCDFPDAEKHVKYLMRHGVLSGYAQLVEERGGMVSQHEYTFYIAGPRAEVTTLP
ncbi:MAG: type II methionyl aminopeptidase [Candidatus Methanomethylophilaceae archaeon]|nr:type II methionyl aminopeptidase [Candidatus Methanomethylophilaceae archaeon]